MTEQQHPITPPPELVNKWLKEWLDGRMGGSLLEGVAANAAQWAADQELEACCEWVSAVDGKYGPRLRLARRPKSKSLKQQLKDAILAGNTKAVINLLEDLDDHLR